MSGVITFELLLLSSLVYEQVVFNSVLTDPCYGVQGSRFSIFKGVTPNALTTSPRSLLVNGFDFA